VHDDVAGECIEWRQWHLLAFECLAFHVKAGLWLIVSLPT
jgi:hypothetical protein